MKCHCTYMCMYMCRCTVCSIHVSCIHVHVQDESMMSKAFHSMAIYILMNLPDSSSILSFRKAVYICMTLKRSVSIFFIFLQRGRRRHEIVACIQFTTVFVQRTVGEFCSSYTCIPYTAIHFSLSQICTTCTF